MKRRKQAEIFSHRVIKNFKASFGGVDLKSHPKTARPVSTKDLIHVVLKSKKAKGSYSFLRHERYIIAILHGLARDLFIQVKDAVVMGNHIHLLIRVRYRETFKAYLRALSGLIVRRILGVEKGKARDITNFFSGRPFSRIVAQGQKSLKAIVRYFELNRLEKKGLDKAQSRKLGLTLKTSSA